MLRMTRKREWSGEQGIKRDELSDVPARGRGKNKRVHGGRRAGGNWTGEAQKARQRSEGIELRAMMEVVVRKLQGKRGGKMSAKTEWRATWWWAQGNGLLTTREGL